MRKHQEDRDELRGKAAMKLRRFQVEEEEAELEMAEAEEKLRRLVPGVHEVR